jgi:hypothetical protein
MGIAWCDRLAVDKAIFVDASVDRVAVSYLPASSERLPEPIFVVGRGRPALHDLLGYLGKWTSRVDVFIIVTEWISEET